jgi:hypothetical protein
MSNEIEVFYSKSEILGLMLEGNDQVMFSNVPQSFLLVFVTSLEKAGYEIIWTRLDKV